MQWKKSLIVFFICLEIIVATSKQPQPLIFMVPRIYWDHNPSCFDPREVSIGPFHKGHKNVQTHDRGMKRKYVRDLLARLKSPPEQTWERCFKKIQSSINEIKLCYGGMLNYGDSDVAKMMVVDACFIVELIQKIVERDYSGEDRFLRVSILYDLLRIENQIPFFVLQSIFDLTLVEIQQNNSLISLLLHHVLPRFHPFKAELKVDSNGNDGYNYKHILDILHKACRPDLLTGYGSPKGLSHTVVQLDRAGVKFKPNRRSMAMGIEYELFGFFGKPTLKMPVLNTEDTTTEVLLRNLIAYEQFCPNVDGHYFTSFAVAMDTLVDSTLDLVKLVESKVIVNRFRSNEDALKMIKSMCSGVVCETFTYEWEFQQLDDFYQSYRPINQGWRNFFCDLGWTSFGSLGLEHAKIS